MNTNYTIGQNIRRIRSYRGYKQEAFAKNIGVSRTTMSNYENGHLSITVDKLTNIANKLNVSLEELLVSNSYIKPA